MPSSRLDEIVENKKLEVSVRKQQVSLETLRKQAKPAEQKFLQSLRKPFVCLDQLVRNAHPHIIAEIKPKSPSAGILNQELPLEEVIAAYNEFASGISVLTDEKYFGGSLQLLTKVSADTIRPTLCKDFVIDPYQCYEARCAGAQAVLLIVKILDRNLLAELQFIIYALGMTAVVEVQTEEEMKIALSVDPSIILINNRNLTTFTVDLKTTEDLAPMVPPEIVVIGASGVETRADVDRLAPFCHALLVGSSLMRAPDIKSKLAELCTPSNLPLRGAL